MRLQQLSQVHCGLSRTDASTKKRLKSNNKELENNSSISRSRSFAVIAFIRLSFTSANEVADVM